MQLPITDAGDTRSLPVEIVLNLSDVGQLTANNATIESGEIVDFLQQEKLRLSSDGTTPRVRLRCDADCSTTHVNLIFERLSELGFEAVVVAVKKQ